MLLDATVDDLSDSLTGINPMLLNVNGIFNEILATPEEFGFTNVSEPCLDPVTFASCSNPDEGNR